LTTAQQHQLGEKSLEHLGAEAQLTSEPEVIAAAEKIVVPGVGHFSRCDSLNKNLAATVLKASAAASRFWAYVLHAVAVFGQHGAPETPGAALFP